MSVIGAVLLIEPLAGLVIVLMQRGGEALERIAEGRASARQNSRHSFRKAPDAVRARGRATLLILDPWNIMRGFTPGANVTVFLLFFGVALIDAMQEHDWFSTTLWITLGLMFVWADMRNRSHMPTPAGHSSRERVV